MESRWRDRPWVSGLGPSPDPEDALGRQLRAFLDAVPLRALGDDAGIRRQCRQELHRARQCGLLTRGILDLTDLSLFSSESADRQNGTAGAHAAGG